MKKDPKFRFPLPSRINRSQIDICKGDAEVEEIGERLYQLSCKVISKDPLKDNKSLLIPLNPDKKPGSLASEIQPKFKSTDVYVKAGINTKEVRSNSIQISKERRTELDTLPVGAQKTDLNPKIGKKKMKILKKEEREKTKGPGWFGMAAPEMTEEKKRDLEILQMRSVLDPKRFYKKNDLKTLPKYFQIGHVLDSPADYYSDRLTKKERKKTLVDELMADAEFKRQNKRKYVDIIEQEKKYTRKYTKKKKAGK